MFYNVFTFTLMMVEMRKNFSPKIHTTDTTVWSNRFRQVFGNIDAFQILNTGLTIFALVIKICLAKATMGSGATNFHY